MNETSNPDYYGIGKVRSSLFHFLFGKGFSAVASLIVVITIIRELEIAEYAVYATLHALVIFARLLTSFGVNSAVLRFLPDLRVVGNNAAAYALLALGVGLRALLYIVPIALVFLFASDLLAGALNLGDWSWVLGWYLVVGFFRVTATFTMGALESLLWQKQAQYSIAVSTLLRLVGVFYLISAGEFNLWSLVLLELATEALSVLLLFITGFVKWRRDPQRSEGEVATLNQDAGRYARFSFWAYLFNLTTVLHGSAPNRLIVSYLLGPASVALFGAVDRLIQFVKQYEPVKLLLGLVRPVFNAQYRSREDFPKIVTFADGLFRVNLAVLALPLLPCAVAGEWIFEVITAGKYTNAAGLFLGFYCVLVLGSYMMVLELIVKAVELTRIFVTSNLVLSTSVLIALPFLPRFGLWALVCANVLGYIAAIAVVSTFLHRQRLAVRVRWKYIAITVFAAGLGIAAGRALLHAGVAALLAIAATIVIYGACMVLIKPFTPQEIDIGRQILNRKRIRNAH